jgi:hypothetical protein
MGLARIAWQIKATISQTKTLNKPPENRKLMANSSWQLDALQHHQGRLGYFNEGRQLF